MELGDISSVLAGEQPFEFSPHLSFAFAIRVGHLKCCFEPVHAALCIPCCGVIEPGENRRNGDMKKRFVPKRQFERRHGLEVLVPGNLSFIPIAQDQSKFALAETSLLAERPNVVRQSLRHGLWRKTIGFRPLSNPISLPGGVERMPNLRHVRGNAPRHAEGIVKMLYHYITYMSI